MDKPIPEDVLDADLEDTIALARSVVAQFGQAKMTGLEIAIAQTAILAERERNEATICFYEDAMQEAINQPEHAVEILLYALGVDGMEVVE